MLDKTRQCSFFKLRCMQPSTRRMVSGIDVRWKPPWAQKRSVLGGSRILPCVEPLCRHLPFLFPYSCPLCPLPAPFSFFIFLWLFVYLFLPVCCTICCNTCTCSFFQGESSVHWLRQLWRNQPQGDGGASSRHDMHQTLCPENHDAQYTLCGPKGKRGKDCLLLLRCSSVVRASDRHAADAGFIPPVWQGIFLPESTFSETLLWCLYIPRCSCMQCTLKIL